MLLNCISWNILASGFTNFTRGYVSKDDGETEQDMITRYNQVIKHITLFVRNIEMDFITLQEVDPKFHKMINEDSYLSNKLGIVYHDNVIESNYKFKVFNMILYNKDKWNLKSKFFLKITPQKHITTNKSNQSKPKKSQIALTGNFELLSDPLNTINIISTKLSGIDNSTIRSAEITNLLDMLQNNRNDIVSISRSLIFGDFNEQQPTIISDAVSGFNYKIVEEYFKRENFATSFHPWNIDWGKREMFHESDEKLYEIIDYAVIPSETTVNRVFFLPDNRHGLFGKRDPYDSAEKYDISKWPSDHTMLFFSLELELIA
jgi:endonuclease/exonuclease/phosphatase family metal-dependent hydrolase